MSDGAPRAPISKRTGATGTTRCEESGIAIHGAGRLEVIGRNAFREGPNKNTS